MLRMVEPTCTVDNWDAWKIWYGPVAIKIDFKEQPWLSAKQKQLVSHVSGGDTWPVIEGCCFLLAQRARHNARHALAIGCGLSRPIEVSRLLQRGPSAADDV